MNTRPLQTRDVAVRHAPLQAPGMMVLLLTVVTLASAAAWAQEPEPRGWTIAGETPQTVTGAFEAVIGQTLTIRTADGRRQEIALADLTPADRQHAMAVDDGEAPRVSPPWVDGYRVRYLVRVAEPLQDSDRETVTATLPTGGWLTSDVRDLTVRSASGEAFPAVVLTHDPLGDTTIQWRRNGYDRWYWVYAHWPDAPARDVALEQRIEGAKMAAQAAVLNQMALAKESAKKAGELRDLTAVVERHRQTRASAVQELEAWQKLLPERQAAAVAAAAEAPPAQQAVEAAQAAHAEPQRIADEKTKIANELQRAAAELRATANQAKAAHDGAVNRRDAQQALIERTQASEAQLAQVFGEARLASTRATSEHHAAERAAAAAEAQAEAATGNAKPGAERRARIAREAEQEAGRKAQAAAAALADAESKLNAARATLAQAREALPALAQAIPPLAATMQQTEAPAAAAEARANEAGEVAREARLAAAPTATALQQAQQTLNQRQAVVNSTAAAVREAEQRIAAATKIRNDQQARLDELEPQLPPAQKAADDSMAAYQQSIADAQRLDREYFDLAASADPRLYREGMTVEYRAWEGDRLASWAEVLDGLKASDNVIGGAMVGSIIQNTNPFRRSDGRNFAASYRGYLQVDQPGVYSFFANGDDATFVFINGYSVYTRTGSNQPIRGRVPLYSVGGDIQLEAGVHPIEVHQVVGNTPSAQGLMSLLWIPPGGNSWSFVPRASFSRSLTAVPVTVESYDGRPVATFQAGVDDTLSADGLTLYLTRLQAHGRGVSDAGERLVWSFEDGSGRRGASVGHVFFEEGDHEVSLKSHPAVAPFRRRVHVWTPPTPTSPLSLRRAVDVLAELDFEAIDVARLNDAFHFLSISEQPERWPVIERLTRRLLREQSLDVKYRVILYASLMQAMAEQGRGADALELTDELMAEASGVAPLEVLAEISVADLQRDYIRDFAAADRIYTSIIAERSRLRHPLIREAAVAWGDLFMQAGDQARAGEAYRLAQRLGVVGAGAAGADDPVKRGALLRVAEQQLREGNIRQTRRLLRRIESEFPEQKLEGLYRFLRGEAERYAGRYEDAILNYEVLLQLRQWAGYRANALFGIADSYYRMGDFPLADRWLEELAENFPAEYEQRRLGGVRQRISQRIQRIEERSDQGEEVALFDRYVTGFSPDDPYAPPPPAGARRLPLMGIHGPDALSFSTIGGARVSFSTPTLENLPTQGSLWVELWVRDRLGAPGAGDHRFVTVQARGSDGAVVDTQTVRPGRSFGMWQKIAFAVTRPDAIDAGLSVTVQGSGVLMDVDGLVVAHVSDAMNDALRNFIDGASAQ